MCVCVADRRGIIYVVMARALGKTTSEERKADFTMREKQKGTKKERGKKKTRESAKAKRVYFPVTTPVGETSRPNVRDSANGDARTLASSSSSSSLPKTGRIARRVTRLVYEKSSRSMGCD